MAQILVTGWIGFNPEKCEEILTKSLPLIKDARAQEGCLEYHWSEDPLTPGRLYVYERWQDEAALKSHFENTPYKAMTELLLSYDISGTEVLKYKVGAHDAIYDSTGTVRADFFNE